MRRLSVYYPDVLFALQTFQRIPASYLTLNFGCQMRGLKLIQLSGEQHQRDRLLSRTPRGRGKIFPLAQNDTRDVLLGFSHTDGEHYGDITDNKVP